MGKIVDKKFVQYILNEMIKCVKRGDFVVIKTDKNKTFASEFNITDELRRSMLLDVKVEDYFNSDESRNFSGRFIHEFCPKYELYNMLGIIELVDVYIKFEIEEEDTGKQTVVIGLHRPEKEIRYVFKNKN